MKRNNLIKLLYSIIFYTMAQSVSSQTIDYTSFTTSQCNAFYPSVNFGGLQQTTTCGAVLYDNVNHAIELDEAASNNIYTGTEFKIASTFKQGYSYTITVNAWCNTPTSPIATPNVRVDFTSASGGGGTTCNGPESINTTSSLTSINNKNRSLLFV